MQLQRFVTEVIEGLGGVVIPVEYALCQVLVPDACKGYFQNKTELELAFDFEVFEENPQSEFVTFGSYVFDQVLLLANQKAVSTIRFAEVVQLKLANPIKKISEFLKGEHGTISIIHEKPVMGTWAVFEFNTALITDERQEQSDQVWVDLLTGRISEKMKQEQNRIVFEKVPLYDYPIPVDLDIGQAFQTAYQEVLNRTNSQLEQRLLDPQLKKDLNRIEAYYTELLDENEKRMNRKGISQEKLIEIKAKSTSIEIEKQKQLEEIQSKYYGQIELTLAHGIMYFVPLLEFEIDIRFRNEKQTRVLYYNPITKEFAEV